MIAGLAAATTLLALGQGSARRWRRGLGEVAWTAVGGAVVCFTVLGYAVWQSSLAEMWYATYTHVTVSYRHHNVGSSFLFGQATWAARLFPRYAEFTYPWLLDSIPALLAIEAAALLWALWRQTLGLQLIRAALLVFALSAIGGIAYFTGLAHVAFVTPFFLPVLAGMVYRARTSLAVAQRAPARAAALAAWVAVLAMVLVKGWTNRQVTWERHPVLYDTAFGTIAGTNMDQSTIAVLREKLRVDDGAPPRMFAYPSDAWLYLTVPADNPTPFCLLRSGYNTPEQFQTAKEHLDRDPRAFVFLNPFLTRPRDPFVEHVRSRFHAIGDAGYGTLYRRNPQS
jgi:hypothetical protein